MQVGHLEYNHVFKGLLSVGINTMPGLPFDVMLATHIIGSHRKGGVREPLPL